MMALLASLLPPQRLHRIHCRGATHWEPHGRTARGGGPKSAVVFKTTAIRHPSASKSPECARFAVRRHAKWPSVTGRVTVAEHATVVDRAPGSSYLHRFPESRLSTSVQIMGRNVLISWPPVCAGLSWS
jgi:hypothetical protein